MEGESKGFDGLSGLEKLDMNLAWRGTCCVPCSFVFGEFWPEGSCAELGGHDDGSAGLKGS